MPTKSAKSTKSTKPAKSAAVTKPTTATKATKPAKPRAATKPAKSTKPATSAKSAAATKVTKPAKARKATKVTKPAKTRKATKATKATKSTDAIVVLKDEHQQMRKLFADFQASGENATATKGELASRIIEKLTIHTYMENEVMYPEVRKLLPDLEDDILESYEEHHVADVLCMELYAMEPDAERFDAKMTVLIENVTHHMDEEEQDWFPKVRTGLSRTTLREIGTRMIEVRKTAPRSPAQPSALKKVVDAVLG